MAKSTVPEYIASNALSHAEKLIRSDGAKISPEMRAKVETIATSVPVLCRVFESKLAREHASK